MSVWTELSEEMQNNLTDSLYEALKTSDHSEIIQTILNLAEFMDHSEKVQFFILFDAYGVHQYQFSRNTVEI